MTTSETVSPDPARAILSLIRPYEPAKAIEEVKREYGLTRVIKLASNENPLGPSPKAVEAIIPMMSELHRYPDPSAYALKGKIADRVGLSREWIVLGNGSTEIVEQVSLAFLNPGDEAITGKEMFFKYPISIRFMSAEPVLVPLVDHKLRLDDVLERVTHRTKVIFIANPNNPTGTMIPREELDDFMARIPPGIVVVLDEAYHEFLSPGQDPDFLRYVREGRNVIILRTFSKIYGLAGLRVGYGIAPPHMIASLEQVREVFNTNSVGQHAAAAAMDDAGFIKKTLENNEKGKRYLAAGLEKIGIPPVPTCTNFFFLPLPVDCRILFEQLLRRGVIVRPMARYDLHKAIRVTVGLPEENEEFLRAIAEVL
ncbi:MAG: histidinol-phosphate transaminase [Candidatus Eisenbacteria bacterium]